jgi:hypothetical protein
VRIMIAGLGADAEAISRNTELVAPMDTSHLAQHAGTAGAVFA